MSYDSFRCVMICGRLNTLITSRSGCGGYHSSRVIDGPMSVYLNISDFDLGNPCSRFIPTIWLVIESI